jgi:hypothetical protein
MIPFKVCNHTFSIHEDWSGFKHRFLVWDIVIQSHDAKLSQRISYVVLLVAQHCLAEVFTKILDVLGLFLF